MGSTLHTLRFGIVTDIHHTVDAGREDILQEESLLRHCTDLWDEEGVTFAVQLGDLISDEGDRAPASLGEVTDLLSRFGGKLVHVPGNHCLAVPLARFLEVTGMHAPYFSLTVDGIRFLFLNGMDVSVLSEPENDSDRNLLEHYRGQAPYFCGAVGTRQLEWLISELEDASARRERVVVFCHLPLLPDTTDEKHGLLWNHDAVTGILLRYGIVRACFGGHYHPGGYAMLGGIHFIVLPAFVTRDRTPGFPCGIAEIGAERLLIRSIGGDVLHDLDFA